MKASRLSKSRCQIAGALVLLAGLFLPSTRGQQSTASLNGTIRDSSGAVAA